jgi:hypothetical protein
VVSLFIIPYIHRISKDIWSWPTLIIQLQQPGAATAATLHTLRVKVFMCVSSHTAYSTRFRSYIHRNILISDDNNSLLVLGYTDPQAAGQQKDICLAPYRDASKHHHIIEPNAVASTCLWIILFVQHKFVWAFTLWSAAAHSNWGQCNCINILHIILFVYHKFVWAFTLWSAAARCPKMPPTVSLHAWWSWRTRTHTFIYTQPSPWSAAAHCPWRRSVSKVSDRVSSHAWWSWRTPQGETGGASVRPQLAQGMMPPDCWAPVQPL